MTPWTRSRTLALAVATALVVLAACGSSDPEQVTADPTTSTSSSTSTSTSTSTTAAPQASTTTWIPIGVDCSSQPLPRFDTVPDPRPTPEEAVRWWGDQPPNVTSGRVLVQPDDEVRLVGDPNATIPIYVSIRAGTPVATFGLDQGADGWRATPWEGCRRDLP